MFLFARLCNKLRLHSHTEEKPNDITNRTWGAETASYIRGGTDEPRVHQWAHSDAFLGALSVIRQEHRYPCAGVGQKVDQLVLFISLASSECCSRKQQEQSQRSGVKYCKICTCWKRNTLPVQYTKITEGVISSIFAVQRYTL